MTFGRSGLRSWRLTSARTPASCFARATRRASRPPVPSRRTSRFSRLTARRSSSLAGYGSSASTRSPSSSIMRAITGRTTPCFAPASPSSKGLPSRASRPASIRSSACPCEFAGATAHRRGSCSSAETNLLQSPERTVMRVAMIGLGKMGGNMTARLLKKGHEVVAFDRSAEAVQRAATLGARAANDLKGVVAGLEAPRVVWIMVPAGKPVDDTIEALVPMLAKGDIIIDGGNSKYSDSLRRARALETRGIDFVDAGTSGGVWGLENGYCLMVGGSDRAISVCEPLFTALSEPGGYAHVGPPGAGHYVKMVHNGIEYGLLQAYAEGYEILHASKDFKLDLAQIAALWNHGSVVRSWLNELAERAFAKDTDLAALKGWIADSGEGRWTVQEATDLDVPAPVIALSLIMRLRSRQDDSFGAKVIAALRNEFGGHAVKTS